MQQLDLTTGKQQPERNNFMGASNKEQLLKNNIEGSTLRTTGKPQLESNMWI